MRGYDGVTAFVVNFPKKFQYDSHESESLEQLTT